MPSVPSETVAVGDSLFLAITMRLYTAQVGRWRDKRADIIAIAPAADGAVAAAAEVVQAAQEKIFYWRALPLPLRKEWVESMWANITSPQPRLFLVYRIENDTVFPTLTVAGDEAAGYGEVDCSVLPLPLPAALLQRVEQFVAQHYKPRQKKVRKRQ